MTKGCYTNKNTNLNIVYPFLIAKDCQWSDWQIDNSRCPATCGYAAVTAAFRYVLQDAENGGKQCNGTLTKIIRCGPNSCPGKF